MSQQQLLLPFAFAWDSSIISITGKLKENIWLEKQKLRNRVLYKARAKFCNFKFKRRQVPISDDQIGILNYYLDMESNSAMVILETAVILRKKLSVTTDPIVVQAGIPDVLVKLLDDDEVSKHFHIAGSNGLTFKSNIETITTGYLDQLRFEVVWSLTNIVSESSASTDYVVGLNCLGNIKKLIENSESSSNLLEQSIWLLGNISGDSTHNRDLVLNEDVLPILTRLLKEKKQLSFLRNATWCLSNLVRGVPCIAIEYVKIALPTLIDLICNETDEEVLADACWAISQTVDRPMDDSFAIDYFLESGAITEIISLIKKSGISIQTPSLLIIGTIVASGKYSNIESDSDNGILEVLCNLIPCQRTSIRKSCLWILSNIASESANQTRNLIKFGLIQQVVDIINDPNITILVKKEAYCTMKNICRWSDEDISKYLFDCDIVKLFHSGLNGEACSICLEGIHELLKKSTKTTLEAMNKYGVVELIETIFPELNEKDQDFVQSILLYYLLSLEQKSKK